MKKEVELQKTLLRIVNVYSEEKNDEKYKGNLFYNIKNQKFKDDLIGKNIYFREIEYDLGYKKLLKKEEKIKTEFHGIRDFYNIIKGVAIEGSKLNIISDENQISPIIENYIERNFGGISYKKDIDFDLQPNDIKYEMDILKEILLEEIKKVRQKKNYTNREQGKDKIIKVTSVYLFKKNL